MSASDNLLANYSKVEYTSYYQSDMIIGIHSGSFTVAAPSVGSNTTNTDTFTTGFGTSCYFQGIFSTDGGTTWNDFGVYIPNLTTAGQPVFQTVTCRGYITSSGVFTAVGINWYDLVHSSGTSKTIQYKVAFFAKQNQGSISPLSYVQKAQFDSRLNVQKIYLRGTFAASTTSNTTITHSLGYIPKVRSFFEPTSSTAGVEGVATMPAGAMATLDWFTGAGSGLSADVEITTTTAVFTPLQSSASTPNGIAGTQHYLIYLDA